MGRQVGILFYLYFFNLNNSNAHLAVIKLHHHRFCVYKGKRKLKLPITCEGSAVAQW